MRKKAWRLMLVCLLVLAGCSKAAGGVSQPPLICMDDSVTAVDVSHTICGQTTQWSIDGADLDSLKAWTSDLEYRLQTFEEGESPGDCDGGEVYDFTPLEGEYPGFCYIINGLDKCYLLIDGSWYFVSNPSDPPVEPTDNCR